jgi:hypothetical protein
MSCAYNYACACSGVPLPALAAKRMGWAPYAQPVPTQRSPFPRRNGPRPVLRRALMCRAGETRSGGEFRKLARMKTPCRKTPFRKVLLLHPPVSARITGNSSQNRPPTPATFMLLWCYSAATDVLPSRYPSQVQKSFRPGCLSHWMPLANSQSLLRPCRRTRRRHACQRGALRSVNRRPPWMQRRAGLYPPERRSPTSWKCSHSSIVCRPSSPCCRIIIT